MRERWRRRLPVMRLGTLAAAASLVFTFGPSTGAVAAETPAHAVTRAGCDLQSQGNRIKHVVNVVFDNTHFTRDDPNVPSDLEQMPNLLRFITDNGVMISHEHTPLISHTGTNILTSITGLYGDGMGQPVSNSFGFYDTDAAASFRASFQYWTDRLGGANDNTFYMTTPDGHNTPAPWVPFTRAGCSVGAVAQANTVLENTGTNIQAVFGAGSPEDLEVKAAAAIPCGGSNPPCTPEQLRAKALPAADFVGIAIHCGRSDGSCAGATGARPDVLPDEPGGYSGFSGLFGAKYVAPHISQDGLVRDVNGSVITDPTGNPGFPGFDGMAATVSLGYVAAMQEHGIPVTNAYISDVHDNHATRRAFGPGDAGYVAALKAYDDAFGKFFERLRGDGITKDNTLFTFTADEGDHFVGGQGSPAGCDGVTVPCSYQQIGELTVNLAGLLGAVAPYSSGTPVPAFSVHSDSAPTVYLGGNPSQTDPATRTVERAARLIQAANPITQATDRVTAALAGTAAMRNLHMLSGDPRRNPTFTLFADPNYFVCTGASCAAKGTGVVEDPGFAWNHGDVQSDITTTWLGLVGPGVRHLGVDDTTWSDHADDRPTELALLGLKDGYLHEGRVLVEVLDRRALPHGFGDVDAYARLAQIYKQVNAPVGQFGRATLKASTEALESGTPQNDAVFTTTTARLTDLGARRDALVATMTQVLDRPVSTAVGRSPSASATHDLGQRGLDLLQQAWLAAGE